MIESSWFNFIFIVIVIGNVLILQISFIKSFKKFQMVKIDSFRHLQFSWLLLSFFWLGLIIVDLFNPLNKLSFGILLNIIIILASPMVLELFYFYLNLFSNRLNIIESYIPPIIGLTIGLSITAIVSQIDSFYLVPIVLITIICCVLVSYFVLLYLRIKKLESQFSQSDNEKEFLKTIKMLLGITIVACGYDIFWFPMALVLSNYFYLILSFGFLLLIAIMLFFNKELSSLMAKIESVDLSLIINELN